MTPTRKKKVTVSDKFGKPPYKLNVGCGRNIKEGWINLDSAELSGVNLVHDLDNVRDNPIALPDESVERFLLSHVLEHVRDSLGLMQDLWRLARPDAVAVIRTPHGGSDDAWEDQTHLRAYFPRSFGFFSQPFYWRADYGYKGDWNPEKITLLVDAGRCKGLTPQQAFAKTQAERNIVREMVCEMRAVKPAREPKQELMPKLNIEIVNVQ